MVGIYIFGVLVVVGLVVLMFLRTKWSRADRAVARGRAEQIEEKIEEERIAEVAKAESRGNN